jgi:hypothetical protein
MEPDEWDSGWPVWRDDGRMVEVDLGQHRRAQGKLYFEDTGRDDDGEYPIWMLRLADGSLMSFVDHERWRFLTATK